jgi:mono/diheme cytochrome c family protein
MPKLLFYGCVMLVVLAMIPPALIARTRAVRNETRRIHLIQDMDNQHKFRAQAANALFADGRAMRPSVAGTVARGELREDAHVHQGVTYSAARPDGEWATTFPGQVAMGIDLVRRGQERFNIYCQPCHGLAGYGDGIVHARAMVLVETGKNGSQWVAPKSLHDEAIRTQPVGQLFNTITNGVRTMPSYGSQIPVADRWAIVAYVKALQRSQNARPEDVPADERARLRTEHIGPPGAGGAP